MGFIVGDNKILTTLIKLTLSCLYHNNNIIIVYVDGRSTNG